MYLKIFCFVSVLVAVHAFNFDEELPIYLSDDVLASKLPIAKRSLPNTAKTDLVDAEKISKGHAIDDGKNENHTEPIEKTTKRATTPEVKFQSSDEQKRNDKTDEREIENKEESGLVFLPSFGRRTRRSIVKNDDKDLLNSESNIVFLPSFKRKGFRRFKRDVDGSKYRFYVKRSTGTLNESDNKSKITESVVTEQNEELSDSDTVNREESGLVFLPSFGRRSRRNIAVSSSPPPKQQKTQKVTSTYAENEKHEQEPIKALSSKNNKREVKNETSKQKNVNLNNSGENTRDEHGEESGLVFLPSFGRRSRRSLHEHTPPLYTGQKIPTSSPLDRKHEQEQIKAETAKKTKREVKNQNTEKKGTILNDSDEDTNDESGEESGLVFLPSFGRRSRRSLHEHIPPLYTGQKVPTSSPLDRKHEQEQIKAETGKKTKREVKNQNTEKKRTILNDSDVDTNDESGEESGLVFLPSFGRRSRRSLQERSPPLYSEQKASTSSPLDRKHGQEQIKAKTGKKAKRDVKNQNTEKKKTLPNAANQDTNDESVEESGLVFLPSFGRRSRRSIVKLSSSTISSEQKTSTPLPEDERHDRGQIKKRISAEGEQIGVKNENTEQKKIKPSGADENKHEEPKEESGLVFLPSFGRRHRRDTSSSTLFAAKKEVSTVSTIQKE